MNVFALSSLAVTLVSIVFGVSIYVANRTSRINKSWLTFVLALSLWSIGLYGVTSASTKSIALLWQYVLDIGGILIPVLYLEFVYLSLNMRRARSVWFIRTVAFVLVIVSFTSLFKQSVAMSTFGFYWVVRGPLYWVFPLYFAVVILYAVWLLVCSYRHTINNPLKRGQLRNHLIAAVIGFGGGATNFFPQFFNIYPYGNYFVALYVIFMVYAVLQYRFFDIKIVSAQLFASALVLFTVFSLFGTASPAVWLLHFGYFIGVTIFSVLLVRSVVHEVEQREFIEKQAKVLEETNARQETLIHFIGHEVKGFLTKDIGVFSMLVEGDFGTLSVPAKSFVTEALSATRTSVRSVTSILQAANLKKGTVEYDMTSIDLAPLVKKSFAASQAAAQGKGLVFTLSIDQRGAPYTITGDGERLGEHVFRNLIENAVAYTPKGSITVALGRGENNAIVFAVKDTGVGITKEDKERLFTEGGHGKDSIKVNAHSTGYGLYIAKQIIVAHKGTVMAESEGQGCGTTFVVTFPAVAAPGQES